MALCYGPSNLTRPISISTRSEFSKRRMNAFMCIVSPRYASRAVEMQDWSIAHERVALPYSPFSLNDHNHLNTCFPGKLSVEHEGKINDVRNLLKLKEELEDPIESLVLVDLIQRLGISSHFHKEIETIIGRHYLAVRDDRYGYNSLHDVSLCFRLMRQHGHCISSDLFKNFIEIKNGKFKPELSQDIRGLLELHEAAQLSFDGEDILDEAANFSRQTLVKKCSQELDNMDDGKWSKFVANKLRHPVHKTIARLAEKDFLIGNYKNMNQDERLLRDLAKMDLRLGQTVYQKELHQIARWWNGVGLAENLKISRNQPLKWYTWSMSCLIDDISLSQQRLDLTKSIAFIYLIDDIFDLCGTLDELIIFTEAIHKWDYAAIGMLPDYMKMCYRTLLDTTNDIAHKIQEKHGFNPIDYLKTTWSSLCDAFLVEAKWFSSGKLPTADEYLENGKVSSGIHVVLVQLFFMLDISGDHGTSPLVHLEDMSQLISSVAAILRLWDDLGSAKDEGQDGKDGSYIECYMQDKKGLVSVEQAREKVEDLIAMEWKILNKECLFRLNYQRGTILSFKKACLNMARMVPLMYSYDDDQRLPVLQEYVDFMLFTNATTTKSFEHNSLIISN